MWSKDFWDDSGSDKLTMLTVLSLLGAQEKPSCEEVPEDKFIIVLVWVDCTGGSPLNCATSRLPDQQANVTSKNVFPLKYTPRFYSSGLWESVLRVDDKQIQYCFGNGLCSVEYVCYLIKLCKRTLANKPISEFQRNSNLDFFCIGFVSWKNPSHIKNWHWNIHRKNEKQVCDWNLIIQFTFTVCYLLTN